MAEYTTMNSSGKFIPLLAGVGEVIYEQAEATLTTGLLLSQFDMASFLILHS